MIDEAAKTHTINEIVIVAGANEAMGDARDCRRRRQRSQPSTAYGEISRNIGEGRQRHTNDTANRHTATKYGESPAPNDLRGNQRHMRR